MMRARLLAASSAYSLNFSMLIASILYRLSSKGQEPYLERDSPKLLGRDRNVSTHAKYDAMMDGKQ